MQTYIIHHKIDTLLELWEPLEFPGFRFSAFSIDWTAGRQDGWLANKTIDADTVEEAFRQFSLELHRLVDRIAFIGQCHTAADLESFVITKPGDRRFFYRYTRKRRPVPLHFNEEQVGSLVALEKYEETGDVFRYLREATNATSFYTTLVMLVSALEAMAGTTDATGHRKTDREYIATRILDDDELCERLFRYGEGIRNQILHGGFVDPEMHGGENYNQIIFDAIIDHFNNFHRLKINKSAKGTPRTIVGNYDVWSGWCKWIRDDIAISLDVLGQKFKSDETHNYFEIVDRPDNF